MLPRAVVSEGSMWALKDLFPSWRLTWLLAGDLSFLPCVSLHRDPHMSSQHGNWHPQETVLEGQNTESHSALCDQVGKVSHHHFGFCFSCLLDRSHQIWPILKRKGIVIWEDGLYGFSPLKVLETSLKAHYVISFVTPPVGLKDSDRAQCSIHDFPNCLFKSSIDLLIFVCLLACIIGYWLS